MVGAPKLSVRQALFGSAEYDAILELRYITLREPLGLQFTECELAREEGSYHLGVWANTELAGCVVLTPSSDEQIQLRQCVVREALRGQGHGKLLVRYAESLAQEKQFREIVMHARISAMGFYEKLGYEIAGDPFIELTIPHVTMRKHL